MKLHRHTWAAAVSAVHEGVRELAALPTMNAEHRRALNAVRVLCEEMRATKCLRREPSNSALAHKYRVSERTITNWRREGCPFQAGQWRVLDWLALRRYAPAGAEARFGRQLERRRFGVLMGEARAATAEIRSVKRLHKLHRVPIPDWLRGFRAQPR
jgi:hypothetical protein